MVGIVFFRTLFKISSESNALSGARRLIASRICRVVICASYEISCEWLVEGMFVRSAEDDLGKNAFLNALTFCSFVAAWLFRVDINVDIEMLIMYFLIWKMDLSSTLSTYSFQWFTLARAISSIYSFAFSLHVVLSIACFVRQNIFLNRFASFRSLDSSSFYHRLLCGFEHLRDVVSCTAFVMTSTSCLPWLSMLAVIASSLIGFGK